MLHTVIISTRLDTGLVKAAIVEFVSITLDTSGNGHSSRRARACWPARTQVCGPAWRG